MEIKHVHDVWYGVRKDEIDFNYLKGMGYNIGHIPNFSCSNYGRTRDVYELNPWIKKGTDSAPKCIGVFSWEKYVKILEEIKEYKENMQNIKLAMGDITMLKVDAIVNAANRTLLGGGGVDGAIHRAAGNGLITECKTLGGCETGKAKITKGYELPARYVIHTVGPIYYGKGDEAELLSNCYTNSLNLAKQNDIHSIAFPCISTGVYAYPILEATHIAVESVKDWLKNNEDYNIDVVFCCYDEKTYEPYKKELKL